MKLSITIILFFIIVTDTYAQPDQQDIRQVIAEINEIRNKGCKCGSEWMPAVESVKWNSELYLVANSYARYMARNDHFDHISKEGEDLGDRLDRRNYSWYKIGENLAVGYYDFYAVVRAWLKSPSHCRMLMDGDMTDMGLSKHKTYWVQTFSGDLNLLATDQSQ